MGMHPLRISKREFFRIPAEYRGVWSGNYSHPEWKGRLTVLSGCLGIRLGWLAIEGIDFIIIN